MRRKGVPDVELQEVQFVALIEHVMQGLEHVPQEPAIMTKSSGHCATHFPYQYATSSAQDVQLVTRPSHVLQTELQGSQMSPCYIEMKLGQEKRQLKFPDQYLYELVVTHDKQAV